MEMRIWSGLMVGLLAVSALVVGAPAARASGDVMDRFLAAANAEMESELNSDDRELYLSDLYSRARGQDDPYAWTMLGLITPKLYPGAETWATACDYFRTAAEQGYAPAMHFLGDCYKNGTLLQERADRMMQWYNAAFDEGSWTSFCAIGEQLMFGLLLRRDPGRGFEMCLEAADNGAAGPSLTIAEALIGGWAGNTPDYARAVPYLETALQAGKPRAAYFLAKLHAEGHHTLRSDEQALQYADFAAAKGLVPAYELAARFHFGEIRRDPSRINGDSGWRAFYWATRSTREDPDTDNKQRAELILARLVDAAPDDTLLNWQRRLRTES
jgi:TPR repeat protein